MIKMNADIKKAYAMAKKARLKAYAPYSKFLVGACIKFKNGTFSSGHNIENASFGGTVCAERVAIWKGITEVGKKEIEFIVLVTTPQAVPCGFCLQVMSEFCKPEMPIYLSDTKSIKKVITFGEAMPHRFDSF